MATPTAPLLPVREDWLALQAEPVLEPELPIVDPHHHLWVRPGGNYALDELVADTGAGHNITHTVFIQCRSMYRADGPEAMRPVGSTWTVVGPVVHTANVTMTIATAATATHGAVTAQVGTAVSNFIASLPVGATRRALMS